MRLVKIGSDASRLIYERMPVVEGVSSEGCRSKGIDPSHLYVAWNPSNRAVSYCEKLPPLCDSPTPRPARLIVYSQVYFGVRRILQLIGGRVVRECDRKILASPRLSVGGDACYGHDKYEGSNRETH
jgi:hypothetical protein